MKSNTTNDNYIHLNKIRGISEEEAEGVHTGLKLYKRSITPETLREVSFEKSEQDLSYTEHYECDANKDNGVRRFAINISASDKIIEDCNNSNVGCKEKSKGDKSVSSKVYKDQEKVVCTLLHSQLEKNLVQSAIEHLLNNKAVKVVLVDILERSIEIDNVTAEGGVVKTHTVLLYKNPANLIDDKHEIVVIDPSNFFFSSHLSNKDMSSSIKHDLFDKITTKHNQIQIYTPGNDVGHAPNQWRDCIDVAVKLGFAINHEVNKNNELSIDLNKISAYDFVQEISNSASIDKNIVIKPSAVPYRIKQASTIKVIEDLYNMNKNIDFYIERSTDDKAVERGEELKAKLATTYVPDRYNEMLEDLFNLHSKYHNEYVAEEASHNIAFLDSYKGYDVNLSGEN